MIVSRTRQLNDAPLRAGVVIYWMSRDQRAGGNWAIIEAKRLADESNSPLIVCFTLVDEFLSAMPRQFSFMLSAFVELQKDLEDLNIPFVILQGEPAKEIVQFAHLVNAAAIVTDFDPLRIKRKWKKNAISVLKIPFYETDAHNIVPIWVASDKLEYAAYTIRKKINSKLDSYLLQYPEIYPHRHNDSEIMNFSTSNIDTYAIKHANSVASVDWIKPGSAAARKQLRHFIDVKLDSYSENRNNPNLDALSNMSPYLHFGHISAAEIAIEVQTSNAPEAEKAAYLEELIVRRELSDNFCYYNADYDNFDGLPNWAKITLNEHRDDPREYVYSLDEFENARTHDPFWNAAQNEMRQIAKMHGYMRMYWAKKILEWIPYPEEAVETAIYLNDKYELDGRDPNGYAGVMWSIGGVHDRAWQERPVFGKIRYMNANGLKRKFDAESYAARFNMDNTNDEAESMF